MLDNRIKIFTSLPLATLDRMKLQESLDAIGRSAGRRALANEYRQAARRRGLGSLLLAAAVVGSGVMAERLAGWQYGRRAYREHRSDSRRAGDPDRTFGSHQRRAFQSSGLLHPGDCGVP